MTAPNKETEDDYYCVSLPQSEWLHIDRWLGDNVSLTSIVLTELNKIKKTYEKGRRKTIQTGIASIDAMVGGLCPGEVLYIGSTEEKYNFAVGLNILHSVGIKGNTKVLVFNSGRGQYAYARGLISLCTGVDEGKLQNGQSLSEEEIEEVEETVSELQFSNVSIVSTPNIYIEDICEEIERLQETERPDLVLIDNLSFLTARQQYADCREEHRKIAEKLWSLAKDTRIPIVLIGPLSKGRKKMNNYRPSAADLPAEGILKFFDKVVTVHSSRERQDVINITTIKNPDGLYGYRKIEYDPNCNKLTEIINQNEETTFYQIAEDNI